MPCSKGPTYQKSNGLLQGTINIISAYLHMLIIISSQFRPRGNNKGKTVPPSFVAFLRASLAKLAGYQYINPDLINMEFWTKMPLKFTAVKYYDKSLVCKKKTFFKI